jgi:hypothetical protein
MPVKDYGEEKSRMLLVNSRYIRNDVAHPDWHPCIIAASSSPDATKWYVVGGGLACFGGSGRKAATMAGEGRARGGMPESELGSYNRDLDSPVSEEGLEC